jgi:hypothetical protein
MWSLMRRKGTSRKLATSRSTGRRRELKVNLWEIPVGGAREQVYLNFKSIYIGLAFGTCTREVVTKRPFECVRTHGVRRESYPGRQARQSAQPESRSVLLELMLPVCFLRLWFSECDAASANRNKQQHGKTMEHRISD